MTYSITNLEFKEANYDERDRRFREIEVLHGGVLVGTLEQDLKYNHWNGCDCRFTRKAYSGRTAFVDEKSLVRAKERLVEYFNKYDPDDENATGNVEYLPASEDCEYYPTPSFLVGKMISKIQHLGEINTILEPSAGSGNILDCLRKAMKDREYHSTWSHPKDYIHDVEESTDVIEIDPNLQMILQGKGYRLVSDDFLTYETKKAYDLILMNPPFSNGDEHLLKAISMIEHRGGQVVCILNAETIRNPYTRRRQVLANTIAKYDGKVEYISDAFAHAQRKTGVEVALVYVYIPAKESHSRIYEDLKKAQEEEYSHKEANALAQGTWFEQMVANYELESSAGIKLLEEYDALSPYIMNGADYYSQPIIQIRINDRACTSIDSQAINLYLRALRLRYWRELLSRPELTNRMTSTMSREYSNTVEKMADYDFNLFNVRRVLGDIQCQLNDGVEKEIINLFEELSAEHSWYPECQNNIHYYTGWSTNKAHKIGKKCIIPANGCYAKPYSSEKAELQNYSIIGIISDLEKALDFLNCGTVSDKVSIGNAVKRASIMETNKVSFTYFDVKFYMKGTAHITFHDDAMPLVDRLNIYAGKQKNWLPPFYGKVKYEDLDEKSKATIDSFQGEDAYRMVCENYNEYVIEPKSESLLTISA